MQLEDLRWCPFIVKSSPNGTVRICVLKVKLAVEEEEEEEDDVTEGKSGKEDKVVAIVKKRRSIEKDITRDCILKCFAVTLNKYEVDESGLLTLR